MTAPSNITVSVKELEKVVNLVSKLPWHQANSIMQILVNLPSSAVQEEKEAQLPLGPPVNSSSSSGGGEVERKPKKSQLGKFRGEDKS